MRSVPWLMAVLVSGAAQAASVISTVDTGGILGWYSSIQLDSGKPIVSYQDEGHTQLKFARCVSACGTSGAAWITSIVDHDGDVGFYSSLQLNGGRPVIAYFDVKRGALKLATCVAQCDGASPQWVIGIVDSSSPDTGRFPTLRFVDGKPVIAYRDKANHGVKFAACKANCETATGTWLFSMVDETNDVGRFAHMALNGDKPVIGYYNHTNGDVVVATCVAACTEAEASWVVKVVDNVKVYEQEMQFSLDVDAGKPWISYFDYADATHGSLRVATCTSACDSAESTWLATTVDAVGYAGAHSAIQVRNGRAVVAYPAGIMAWTEDPATGMRYGQNAEDLRLAVCTAGCDTPAAKWAISTADNESLAGWFPSLVVDGDTAVVAYHDAAKLDLKVAWADLRSASLPANHTGLWWDFAESGWGVNFAHQGDVLFATLFTYDASGAPMWLVMSGGAKKSGDVFSGELYRTTGPAFDAAPFLPITPANFTRVGDMTVSFAGDTADFMYSVNGRLIDKRIKKQVFGAAPADCHPAGDDRQGARNYQDLWWNPAESGWGVNVAQQGDVAFATLFTYGHDGKGIWLVMSAGARQADGGFAGDLYRMSGHAFDQLPFAPLTASNATKAGTMRLEFANGVTGKLAYTFDGSTVVKTIERQVFAAPAPACSG